MKKALLMIGLSSLAFLCIAHAGQPDPRRENFKRTDLFPIKLAVSQLRECIINNKIVNISNLLSSDYQEPVMATSKQNWPHMLGDIHNLMSSYDTTSGVRPLLTFDIQDARIFGDSAEAIVRITAFMPEDNYMGSSRVATLQFKRSNSSWQISRSDGFFDQLEHLLLRADDIRGTTPAGYETKNGE